MMQNLSTYSPEDSPANLFPSPDADAARKIIASSGQRCFASYASFLPAGSSLRTFADYLVKNGDWYSSRCALTWKGSHTTFKRLLFQLQVSALPTAATVSGLLHTPTTGDTHEKYEKRYQGGKERKSPIPNLAAEVAEGIAYADKVRILPTPTALEDRNERMKKTENDGTNRHSLTLAKAIMMLPTPDAWDGQRGGPRRFNPKGKSQSERTLSAAVSDGNRTGLKLQPAFVEWMMGYPEGWTELPDSKLSEMRLSRKSRKKS
jgi:hypothetical protein